VELIAYPKHRDPSYRTLARARQEDAGALYRRCPVACRSGLHVPSSARAFRSSLPAKRESLDRTLHYVDGQDLPVNIAPVLSSGTRQMREAIGLVVAHAIGAPRDVRKRRHAGQHAPGIAQAT
jgi:hypothetical protein